MATIAALVQADVAAVGTGAHAAHRHGASGEFSAVDSLLTAGAPGFCARPAVMLTREGCATRERAPVPTGASSCAVSRE
jgi:hypothetical protein